MEYIFQNLEDNKRSIHMRDPWDMDTIHERIGTHFAITYMAKSDEDYFKTQTVFEKYHY